ncbi:ABC transporter substrate-binding protein [Actinotalea sp. K2]|uniref:ABC transporter substrate-binding protein n=1 Tax=Actinotalea sp. K2 TaxID=2939438 RepID=UPI002017F566|nr:extracellular solute-binding protein [Actinotalea sp. K2]MCL3861712.1 extracellular solute-binding protein [Actinotalea sp. K2]
MSILTNRPSPTSGVRRAPARVGIAAAVAGSLLALSACSTDGEQDAGGTTTLSFFSWDGEPVMAPVIEAFEEQHQDIQIEFSSAPPVQEYISTLQTRISSGTAADVFIMAAENKTNLIEGEFVVPLTGEPFMENIAEFNQQTYGADGEVYAMSLSSWGGGIVYNREHTDAVGMSDPPTDWDAFRDLLADLEDTGVAAFYENLQEIPMSLQALVGGSYESDFTVDQRIFDGETTFEAEWTEPLQTWAALFEDGLMSPDVVGLSGDQILDEFANGRVAMMATGPWSLPTIRETAPDMDFGFMPFPAPAGQEAYLPGAASPGYAINSATDNEEAAKTFLAFLASPEGVQLYNESSSAITTTGDFEPTVDPVLEDVVEPIREGRVYLAQISWPRYEDVLMTTAVASLQQVILGQREPADVATALDEVLEQQS